MKKPLFGNKETIGKKIFAIKPYPMKLEVSKKVIGTKKR
jgi:hypothetical protein